MDKTVLPSTLQGDLKDRCSGLAALCMLLACGAALAIGGCSGKKLTRDQAISRYSQELREAVSTSVSDERRKAEMLLTVDQLETLQRSFSQETVILIEGYRKLNTDYDTPRSAFEQLFSKYGAKRIKARDAALNQHFHLVSLATASEWNTIGEAETKLYKEVNAARPADESTK